MVILLDLDVDRVQRRALLDLGRADDRGRQVRPGAAEQHGLHPRLDLVIGDLGDERVDPLQHLRHQVRQLVEGRAQRGGRAGNTALTHPDRQLQQQRQRRGG